MRLIDIDGLRDTIERLDWYHLFNGELRHGSPSEEEGLYKANDIYRVLDEASVEDANIARNTDFRFDAFTCSACGAHIYDTQELIINYCPTCGATIIEDDDELER